jgi:CubicO group peptidase (beta-lactamase class C family)
LNRKNSYSNLNWKPARKSALAVAVAVSAAACGGSSPTGTNQQPPTTQPPVTPIPLTGQAVAGLESFDQIIPELMRKHGIPGGAVALVRDGKLIYARGYGYGDVEAQTRVQPDALFRIASVSKPITAVAILKLVEEGKLRLDDRIAPLISDLRPAESATVDARWERITIRHLLQHTGGWDRDRSFDPMFRPQTAADAVGAPAPASAETVIRYMKGVPLDFDPGARYAYSNFGYAILGRIIERVSGMSYEQYVRTAILAPLGITRMRLGRTRLADQATGEVRYYFPGQNYNGPSVRSVFAADGTVPYNYGGFYLEAMDAHGGWIASTIDLLRFVTAVDLRTNRPDFLRSASLEEMIAANAPVWANSAYWYGLGWLVRPSGGDANWWHNGSLPGTSSIIVRSYHNFAWAALFNARTDDGTFGNELDARLWEALGRATSWPTHDLFSQN